MMISSKGRYALRVMLDLSQRTGEGYVSLKEIAGRQDISMKYLEAIVSVLNKAGFVMSMRGKDGGYKLSRSPAAYSVGEILELTEGSLAPVACMEGDGCSCERAEGCLTLPMWKKLDSLIDGYLNSVSLEDLLEGRVSD